MKRLQKGVRDTISSLEPKGMSSIEALLNAELEVLLFVGQQWKGVRNL